MRHYGGLVAVKKFDTLAKAIVIGASIPILLFLTYYSFRFTVFFGFEYQRIPNFASDSAVNNIVFCGLVVIIFLCVSFLMSKLKNPIVAEKILLTVISLGILFFEFWWIRISQTAPAADQRYVWVGAKEFLEGNFRYLEEGEYFRYYPHQLSFVMFLQIFMKITGSTDFTFFQFFNAFCTVAVVICSWKIFCLFSQKNRERFLFLFVMACCFPLFLYSPFVYNEIVSLTWICLSFYYSIRYLREDKWYFGLGCFLFSILAVMCRKNMLIAVLALMIIFGMFFVRKKKKSYLILGVMIIISSVMVGKICTGYYERLSGEKLGTGVTNTSYFAMGMQEGPLAEGWFNGFNEYCSREGGFEESQSNLIAKAAILERLDEFKSDPFYGIVFYKNKVLKQWNEPTYGGFINNSYHDHRGLTEAANSMYYGALHNFFIEFCNVYQGMIYLFSLIFMVLSIKQRKEIEQFLLAVVFLGGFFFHIIWEADSRYALPYFIFLIPYAVWGISNLSDIIVNWKCILRKDFKILKE